MALNERPASFPGDCPDAEDLAAYAEGALADDRRREIEAHLANCDLCRDVLTETALFLSHAEENQSAEDPVLPVPQPVVRGADVADDRRETKPPLPFTRPRIGVRSIAGVLAIAAALILGVRLFPQWMPWSDGSANRALAELVTAMNAQRTRPVEGRLSGNFTYLPATSPTRGGSGSSSPTDVTLAAATVEKLVEENGNRADDQAALGLARLAAGNLDRAVSALEAAAEAHPSDAGIQNNLAVVYLERGRTARRPDDLAKALAAAERARTIDPGRAEAWFNRAVALDEMRQADQASQAWADYLRVERDPQWQREARERLARSR